ncbi:MAG: ferredoxin [Sciscionella sp.]
MRFTVDLDTCQNHGQCCFVAPGTFALDPESRELAFRTQAVQIYRSGDVPTDECADVGAAADMCPTQAITIVE